MSSTDMVVGSRNLEQHFSKPVLLIFNDHLPLDNKVEDRIKMEVEPLEVRYSVSFAEEVCLSVLSL